MTKEVYKQFELENFDQSLVALKDEWRLNMENFNMIQVH